MVEQIPTEAVAAAIALLAKVITKAARGSEVTNTSAVLVDGHRVNHLLHLLATALLCGMWAPVWLAGGGDEW